MTAAPAVAVAAGIALLGETLEWNQPLGAVIIILGAALRQGIIRLGRRAPAVQSSRKNSTAAAKSSG